MTSRSPAPRRPALARGDAGTQAETLAAAYLAAQGLKLVERNYRCRFGEIDLIVRDGRTLVFVEVRMRASASFGGAAASITQAKQAKLVKAAKNYLAKHNSQAACRFDALLLSEAHDSAGIEWIKNAFSAD